MSNVTTTPKQRKAIARVKVAQQMGLAPSARELFAYLRPILLASRPVIEQPPARKFLHSRGTFRDFEMRVQPPVYGKPTFRNRIDAEGRHV